MDIRSTTHSQDAAAGREIVTGAFILGLMLGVTIGWLWPIRKGR